jgi:hypothetical protein
MRGVRILRYRPLTSAFEKTAPESHIGTAGEKRDSIETSAANWPRQFIHQFFVCFTWHDSGLLYRRFTTRHVFRWRFCIGTARSPIGGRKSDSPESRRGQFKFYAYLSLAWMIGAKMNHTADKLFHGLSVLDSEKLANFDRQGQLDKRSVRIHDESVSLFRGNVCSGFFSKHNDR